MEKKTKKSAREQQHCWDSVGQKILKTTKVHVQNLKVTSTFPIVELAEKGKRTKRTKKEGQRFYYRSSGEAFGAQKSC